MLRNSFYSCYLRNLDLSLTSVGLTGSQRIYVNECLTKTDKGILDAALKLKREKKLSKVYTKNSMVHVCVNNEARAVIIENMSQLSNCLLSPETASTTTTDVTTQQRARR